MTTRSFYLNLFSVLLWIGCRSGKDDRRSISEIQALGREIFFDAGLSSPPGQSCATCHDPNRGFSDPISSDSPTSQGAVAGRFGFRNSPSLSYSAFSPPFHFSTVDEDFIGGQFWDGQASTLQEQARRPFFRAVEMNNSSTAELVDKLRSASYADRFRSLFGDTALNDPEQGLSRALDALAAFESSADLAKFSSKFDAVTKGKASFTTEEARGFALFNDPTKGNCAACHPSTGPAEGVPALFTDFTYDNIGIARNEANPFYVMSPDLNPEGAGFVDRGLQTTTGRESDAGRFKVMTLRNIAETAPYFHNGIFKTLEEVVHFYNSRDLDGIVPEIADGVNTEELGNLGLTAGEEKDIVAFLRTLSDGYEE